MGSKLSKPKGLVSQIDEVSQTFDLKSIVGQDLSPDLVESIAQATQDYMLDRIAQGKGIGGKALKSPYSNEYADSLEFKAAGKSKGQVNMTLSGDMLGSIDITTDNSSFKLAISEDQSPKAFGHMSGFEGHPTIPSGYKREFFGLTQDEFKKNVLSQFKNEIKENTQSDVVSRTIEAVRRLTINRLFEE